MSGEKIQDQSTPEYTSLNKETTRKIGQSALIMTPENGKIVDSLKVEQDDYPIFSQQAGNRQNEFTGKFEERTLSIDETMSRMVGSTALVIATLVGEKENVPPADVVIYLDKSARPVSWLVDAFWDDFTDKKKPEKFFSAIDREEMFNMIGADLESNQYIENPDGSSRMATGRDFWILFDKLPKDKQTELLARFRCNFIEGGIEDEDPEKIMNTPTLLDGKNVVIVDEVSRSGATIDIATELVRRAIGKDSVNVYDCVFWNDGFTKTDNGEYQMGNAPVWYPKDSSDWRGRGIMDPSLDFREREYENDPNPKNRAARYGSAFVGVPLNFEEEEGHLSQKLKDEIAKMHSDYQSGHILPLLPRGTSYDDEPGSVYDNLIQRDEFLGVKFLPEESSDPDSYINILKDFSKIS